jgi:membrane protein implicated in regulation of membrane protease activity
MANGTITPEGPQFPTRALGFWLGSFCACVALVTVWAAPLDLVIQIVVSAVFALVPVGILLYWLGAFMDHRHNRRRNDAEQLRDNDQRDDEL